MFRPIAGIAGAGLAGLTTAIGLAQSDWPVEIFEAAPDSGWGRKGSWDAVENWSKPADFLSLLQTWKITHDFECQPVCTFEVYDPRGECHVITTRRPIIYLVKRGCQPGTLEYALKEQALRSGVAIHYNERRGRQDVNVWAVGAQHHGQFLGAGLRFQTHHPDTVKLLIGARYAPKAYAYLFIVEGTGILSVVLTRNFANARGYLQSCLEFFRRVSPFDMENVGLTSGFGGRRADLWLNATSPLRVGEAAGLQDYLWGFGIRHALHSGYLAAQAIIQGSDYHQAVRTQIHPLVYASLLNRAFYNRAGDHTYRFLIDWFSRSSQLIELLGGRYRASMLAPLLWRFAKPRRMRSLKEGVSEK